SFFAQPQIKAKEKSPRHKSRLTFLIFPFLLLLKSYCFHKNLNFRRCPNPMDPNDDHEIYGSAKEKVVCRNP
ncbi:MAG: hypothetical protein ACE5K2_00705, partial [Candidatus Zixiibacteriota bacterium]